MPRYSIFAKRVGVFEFEKSSSLSPAEKAHFLYYSGISICINALRSIVSGSTAHGPYGKYTIPSVDVNSLLIDKGILKQKDS